MNWIGFDEISTKVPIPDGYRIEQLMRSDIAELVNSLKAWYPDITVGAVNCYLREDFYADRVCHRG